MKAENDERFFLRWGLFCNGTLIAAFVLRDRAEWFAAEWFARHAAPDCRVELKQLPGRAIESLPEDWPFDPRRTRVVIYHE